MIQMGAADQSKSIMFAFNDAVGRRNFDRKSSSVEYLAILVEFNVDFGLGQKNSQYSDGGSHD